MINKTKAAPLRAALGAALVGLLLTNCAHPKPEPYVAPEAADAKIIFYGTPIPQGGSTTQANIFIDGKLLGVLMVEGEIEAKVIAGEHDLRCAGLGIADSLSVSVISEKTLRVRCVQARRKGVIFSLFQALLERMDDETHATEK